MTNDDVSQNPVGDPSLSETAPHRSVSEIDQKLQLIGASYAEVLGCN